MLSHLRLKHYLNASDSHISEAEGVMRHISGMTVAYCDERLQ